MERWLAIDFVSHQNLHRSNQRKEILKKHSANEHKKRPKPVSCAERKRFVKNCGFLAQEQVGNNKQKISPNLMKRTDFCAQSTNLVAHMQLYPNTKCP